MKHQIATLVATLLFVLYAHLRFTTEYAWIIPFGIGVLIVTWLGHKAEK
jgi:hypothetical protein